MKRRHVVFDSHFGDGERFRAAVRARQGALHYIALHDDPLPGFRRIPGQPAGVTLDLLSAPLESALSQLDARIDSFVLHGIAHQGSGFARTLARLAEPGALLHTGGLTPAQEHALASVGFAGGAFTTRKPPSPWARGSEPVRRAIVLGAGLAGSAACERLCARGWQVTLVERHPGIAAEASGNLAGIYMPLLSRDDNIMTRLSRAAFLYALAYWDTLGPIKGARCGVLQLARDADHARVQRAIAGYPPGFAQWLDSGAASAMLGGPAPDGAWLFPQAGWARPSSVCDAMLDACGGALDKRFGVGSVTLESGSGGWNVIDGAGATVASAPVVVLANGCGALDLAQSAGLPLARVRGQVTHLARGALPDLPFVVCREAYLTPAIDGLHSLGASYDDDADPALTQASQNQNLDKIRSLLGDPGIGRQAPLAGRTGFRCVAPDRLPLVGALPDMAAPGRIERLRAIPRHPGLYALLGYASRGLSWAPLAAELLAARLDGEPLPLEADLAGALDPARFLLRARRRPV